VIYEKFKSFQDTSSLNIFLRKAVLLSNYKATFTSSFTELERLLLQENVHGLICDASIREEGIRLVRGSSKYLFTVEPDYTGNYDEQPGSTVTKLSVPVGHFENDEVIESFAKQLVRGHSLDTPRGIGFHGNWFGTYGLIALQQTSKQVNGVYWYGAGEIVGECHLDIKEQILIFEFKWSQLSNENNVGSRSQGDGLFIIPAGHEFFYGYWRDVGDTVTSQTWCGVRVSQDITESIKKGIAPFGSDVGLSIHPREKLLSWGTARAIHV
jgi:hypothetical protein